MESCGFRDESEWVQGEWIWICMISLWQRWWPNKPCLELLDDKIQAGYAEAEHDGAASAAIWLDAWADVLRLCDATGVHSIEEFDERFPMTQSLYNWSQRLEDALWNAGLDDGEFLRARISVCEEALRRFPDQDQLTTENRRRALGESCFAVGETEKSEELFRAWLAADPCWGFGWIGWAACHFARAYGPRNHGRAEELLRLGYSTPGVRNRAHIAEGLRVLCAETGRPREAREFAQQARQLWRRAGRRERQTVPVAVSRKLELEDQAGGHALVRASTTFRFGGEGLPLDQLGGLRAAASTASGGRVPAPRVARNAPCPCGSGRKFKRCCGAGSPAADRD